MAWKLQRNLPDAISFVHLASPYFALLYVLYTLQPHHVILLNFDKTHFFFHPGRTEVATFMYSCSAYCMYTQDSRATSCCTCNISAKWIQSNRCPVQRLAIAVRDCGGGEGEKSGMKTIRIAWDEPHCAGQHMGEEWIVEAHVEGCAQKNTNFCGAKNLLQRKDVWKPI